MLGPHRSSLALMVLSSIDTQMHVFLPNIRYVLGVLPLLMSDSEKSCDFIKCLVFGLRDFAICEDPKKG